MLNQNLIKNSKPLFITFEGGEGVGKSTQIKLIAKALEDAGKEVVITREPGGTKAGEDLRKLLVEGDADRWDGLSETLLYYAARNEHLRKLICPSLKEGKWVVCDRFADSSIVYQGVARGIGEDVILPIHNLVVAKNEPDLTIVLDMDVKYGMERSLVTNAHENRFESLGLEFHEKVRTGFLNLAKQNPNRCVVVSAVGTIEEVQQNIVNAINGFLSKHDYSKGKIA